MKNMLLTEIKRHASSAREKKKKKSLHFTSSLCAIIARFCGSHLPSGSCLPAAPYRGTHN
jgi:hypothetical protein